VASCSRPTSDVSEASSDRMIVAFSSLPGAQLSGTVNPGTFSIVSLSDAVKAAYCLTSLA